MFEYLGLLIAIRSANMSAYLMSMFAADDLHL